jgi:glycosyltransferase involved in cell wall biosynthesis
MRVGIDASNVGGGGGVTHLKEILLNFDKNYFSDKVTGIVVFSSKKVLDQITDDNFIEKTTFPELNLGLLSRIRFQFFRYDEEIKKRCDILFSITGDYTGDFKPLIGMSRNMLLYERDIWCEIKAPKEIIRFWLNFKKQEKCFKNASGIIFISKYAKKYASEVLPIKEKYKTIIHHGISPRFIGQTKEQKEISEYSLDNPYKFLYVSTVHVYKNQWNVVKAIAKLREAGFPVVLSLVGGIIFTPAGKKLFKVINEVDPKREFIFFKGNISYNQIDVEYRNTDGIIYASTCENMPNILIESMASGIPIASSDKEPMPEFLKKGGYYFDAKSIHSIFTTLKSFLNSPKEREIKAKKNLEIIKEFSWKKTSRETFEYIIKIFNT